MKLLICVAFFCLQAFSGVVLKNLNLEYLDFSGEGDFSALHLQQQSWNNQNFLLAYQDEELSLIFDDQDLSLESIPSSIKEISSLSLKALEFNNTNEEKISLSFKSFLGNTKDSEVALSDIDLKCTADNKSSNFLEDVIRNCFHEGDLKESIISIKTPKSKSRFEDGYIKIRDGKIFIESDAIVGLSGKLRISGLGTYDESGKIVTIKVNSAKLGIFSFTSKLLSKLKERESEFLKVNTSKKEIYLDISTLL